MKLYIISKIKESFYLFIPIICIGLWALSYLIQAKFILNQPWDFYVYYYAGKQIFINPEDLYEPRHFNEIYPYMPSSAVFFAFTISLFPRFLAHYIFYILNYIMAIVFIREYNKILILLNVKKKVHRLLFLMIISNGFYVQRLFVYNQAKFIVLAIFFFIMRREIQCKIEQREKDLKFFLINSTLFIFAIGMVPSLLFILIIFMLHDIPPNNYFKKENIRNYIFVFLIFLLQNFLFIMYPSLIFKFINNFFIATSFTTRQFYLEGWLFIPNEYATIISLVFNICLLLITVILTINKKVQIERKLGYFSISYIFLGTFSLYGLMLTLFSFILFLFIPYLRQEEKGFEFIKSNIILIIGLLSIVAILFSPDNYYAPAILREFPFYLRWIFLLSIMTTSLILLYLTKENKEIEQNF